MRPTKAPRRRLTALLTLRPARPDPVHDQIPDPERGLYYQDRTGTVHRVDGIEAPAPRRRR